MTKYSREQLLNDLRLPFRMAGIVISVPLVGLVLAAVASLVTKTIDLGLVLLGIAALAVTYLSMALISGTIVFLLRPLRASWVGWALTGALIMPSCYGIIITTLTVFAPVGRFILTLKGGDPLQPGELPGAVLFMAALTAPIGAAVGLYWRDNPT